MILYFSGTGNSRYAAQRIGELTGDADIGNMGAMIKQGRKGDFKSDKPYIFVVPTYGWRVPHIVEDFISGAGFTGNKKAYFVLTCGDSIGNAGTHAKKLCIKKGLSFAGCAQIKMPENYIAMFNVPEEEQSERIIAAAERNLEKIAKAITSGKDLPGRTSLLGAAESSFINSVFYKCFVKDKGFWVTDRCTGCGLCTGLCVLNNIELKDGRPQWGGNCTHCMACICRCPAEAIEYKNKSRGKRRYRLESDSKGEEAGRL